MARLYWSLRALMPPVKVSGAAYSGVTPPSMLEEPEAFQVLDQAEVADLDAVADEEEVARLDVEVLEVVLLVHVVEAFGRVPDVAQQGVARDADQARRQALLEGVVQAAVGQLHDDDQLAADVLDAVHRQDERMAHLLDALEGLRSCSARTPSSRAN